MTRAFRRKAHDIKRLMFDINRTRSPARAFDYAGFIAILIFYPAFQIISRPVWTIDGIMWAEMATNYYHNSISQDWRIVFLSLDFGYYPLLPRLVAAIGRFLGLPASTVPHFYTWSALLLGSAMAGAFALPRFRVIMPSDLLRVLSSAILLISLDFQSTTFVNFAYLAGPLLIAVAALAVVDEADDVPAWSWFIPLIVGSKPAMVAILPIYLAISVISSQRFRNITILSVILALLNVALLATGDGDGNYGQALAPPWERFASIVPYFFGMVGHFALGPYLSPPTVLLIMIGLLMVGAAAYIVKRSHHDRAGSLVVLGLALLFFNLALNCLTLSASWRLDMYKLAALPFRPILLGYSGFLMTMAGLASIAASRMGVGGWLRREGGAALLLAWAVASGWLVTVVARAGEQASPLAGNDYWQERAEAIERQDSPLCVPVDPFGFVYGHRCRALHSVGGYAIRWQAAPIAPDFPFRLAPVKPGDALSSLGVLVRPADPDRLVVIRVRFELKDGTARWFSGRRRLSPTGGLVVVGGRSDVPVHSVAGMFMQTWNARALAHMQLHEKELLAILPMGR